MFDDVYAWVRLLMPDYADSITSSAYDLVVKAEMRDALSPFGLVFNNLSGDDQDRVNQAVGLRVAAAIVSRVSTGGVGYLSKDDNGESSRQFEGMEGLVDGWLSKANAILNRPSLGRASGAGVPAVADGYPRHCAWPLSPYGL